MPPTRSSGSTEPPCAAAVAGAPAEHMPTQLNDPVLKVVVEVASTKTRSAAIRTIHQDFDLPLNQHSAAGCRLRGHLCNHGVSGLSPPSCVTGSGGRRRSAGVSQVLEPHRMSTRSRPRARVTQRTPSARAPAFPVREQVKERLVGNNIALDAIAAGVGQVRRRCGPLAPRRCHREAPRPRKSGRPGLQIYTDGCPPEPAALTE